MKALLEHIPLSRNEDVPRFLGYFEELIDSGEIVEFIETFHKTKSNVRKVKEELSAEEAEKLVNLQSQIKSNHRERGEVFQDIFERYAGKNMPRDPLCIEEAKPLKKIISIKAKLSSTSSTEILKKQRKERPEVFGTGDEEIPEDLRNLILGKGKGAKASGRSTTNREEEEKCPARRMRREAEGATNEDKRDKKRVKK